jgi:hypothetical protein
MSRQTKLTTWAVIAVVVATTAPLLPAATAKVYESAIRDPSHSTALNITTGRFIPINQAYCQSAPHIRGGWVVSHRRRSLWDFLIGPRHEDIAWLFVANVDFKFAPAKKSGKPQRDYWSDTNTRNWPKGPWRRTSSYHWRVPPDKFGYPILFKTYDGTPGVLKVTNVGPKAQINVRYKIIEPANSVPAPSDSSAVILPDGKRGEIVGIGYCPSAYKTWWKPNGDILPRAPHINKNPVLGPRKPGRTAYELAYRVTAAQGAPVGVTISIGDKTGTSMPHLGDEFGNEIWDLQGLALSIEEDVTSTDIKFGIAGEWQTILAAKENDVSREYDSQFISISQPKVIDGKIRISFTVSRDWNYNYHTRMLAVDYSGKIHNLEDYTHDTTTVSLRKRRHTFTIDNLSLWDIQDFRFDVCRYQWVKFKNISLRPGKNPGFKIEVSDAAPK